MSKIIQQTVTFKASPHDVYEALMDSAKHAAFTGSPAEISREVGGAYSAYDGYITGKNIKLAADREIVQSWRASDWPEGKYSTITFVLLPIPDGTRLNFTHVDVPDGTEEEFTHGWTENYWEPLKKMLEKE
jgi:activator of HSP90 ATPase